MNPRVDSCDPAYQTCHQSDSLTIAAQEAAIDPSVAIGTVEEGSIIDKILEGAATLPFESQTAMAEAAEKISGILVPVLSAPDRLAGQAIYFAEEPTPYSDGTLSGWIAEDGWHAATVAATMFCGPVAGAAIYGLHSFLGD